MRGDAGPEAPYSDWVEPAAAGAENELYPAERITEAAPRAPRWAIVGNPPSAQDALNSLYEMTGIPDLLAARSAAARGEVLPALGQALWGGAQLGSWMLPVGRAGGMIGEAIGPGLGADVRGTFQAFHGTPHIFEAEEGAPFGRFSDAAIGTGEGAQAYGWGHYVAGSKGVAESYLGAGGRELEPYPLFEGKDFRMHPASRDEAASYGMGAFALNGGDLDRTISELRQRAAQYADSRYEGRPNFQEMRERAASGADWLEENRGSVGWHPGGSLLEVHVLPEEEELLDWDKRLSEQSPGVREGLRKALEASDFAGNDADTLLRRIDDESGKLTGESIYKWMANRLASPYSMKNGQQEISKALHEAGVPGLKYLDQQSRARGEGTHNYVIFDPSNLRIVGRNGERLTPVKEDPFEEAKP